MTEGLDAREMRHGIVGLIDILGWKGIWRRHALADVLRVVDTVRDAARDVHETTVASFRAPDQERIAMHFKALREVFATHRPEDLDEYDELIASARSPSEPMMYPETRFLSDTLVISFWVPDDWRQREVVDLGPILRMWVCQSTARVIRACALDSTPLNFRGAIASGEFLVDENLIVGQAIDDAAELMNQADAAIVWFAPPEFSEPEQFQFGQYLDYDIPLHGGRTIRAQAVNPFLACRDEDEVERVSDGMLRAFGRDTKLDLVIKKQNTEAFLAVARERWTSIVLPRINAARASMAQDGGNPAS